MPGTPSILKGKMIPSSDGTRGRELLCTAKVRLYLRANAASALGCSR